MTSFKVLSQQSPEGTEKTKENRASLSPGRDLNPGLPEYTAGVLTTRPRRSVTLLKDFFCQGTIPTWGTKHSAL
jgi:hypothetical protein